MIQTKCVSSVVITELLNQYMDRYNNKEYNIGTLGAESKSIILREGLEILVAIRPKMQRTQKDREIYVLNMDGKFMLYPLEHTYRCLSIEHPFEKISVAGDTKIMDMKKQVDDTFRWIKSEKMLKGNSMKKLVLHHYNMDFNKWSPKDNTLKYIVVIAYNYLLKPSEKLFMIATLCKHYKKKIVLDHSLLKA